MFDLLSLFVRNSDLSVELPFARKTEHALYIFRGTMISVAVIGFEALLSEGVGSGLYILVQASHSNKQGTC